MEDLRLLREYTERRSEQAFSELVRRHTDFVYSTAWRLVGDSQLAEDVTQMVFIRLAQKAGSLHHGTVVAGWLYRTAQFVAQAARRSDWRRRKRESLAMQWSELNRDNRDTESLWKEVAPLLEEAMGQLRQADQDAVLLRFFAGKNLGEVGQALGVSDDTAQKRLNRALERMRNYFARRGVVMPVALLGSTLAAHTVQAAPIHLASTLAASVTSAPGLGLATTLKFFQAMTVAKFKAAGLGAVAAAIIIISGTMALLPTPAGPGLSTNDLSNAAFVLLGQLQTPDGKSVGGARVYVATPGASLRLYYLTNPAGTNARVSKTWTTSAVDGTFAVGLPAVPAEGKAVVAVNDEAGYAVATADELSVNSNVVVQAWGRIEGVLRIGKSLASNETVNIGIWGTSETYEWNSFKREVRTYEFPVQPDGTFRIEDVLPGSYRMQVRADAKVAKGERPRLAAQVETQIEVPDASELAGPLNVGTLTPTLVQQR